ncbi:class I SAM-dependent methyltransferase [Flavisolibacter ginsenosidimutans]|uniref:Class I SAM-dependent methyltransferase n=1 Tax=Flavisolibacter ginsenosidimutans TaxID=661481 RepID=A0A5B8UGG6_9BACT|nr:class I SAM-dependent methyltransferase [Flavisolibacter ginsenosidimutans]QEC55761.1 class I SAM-dependent methyltransferase [Flavisolibacter ginsenosidimutans]
MAKDLFSSQADAYAKYRPTYPQDLFDYILQFVKEKNCVWDCATGNGQAASVLAHYFQTVEATDISEAQLKNAVKKENIHYQICPAEKTPFADDSFDLITVATAYHWLDWNAFYNEASRVGKNDCVVAVWAYNIVLCEDKNVNQLIHDYYYKTIYAYWNKERRHVEASYKTVAFDFFSLPSKDFEIIKQWTKEDLLGYLSTWSALQNYVKQHGASPLPAFEKQLIEVWQNEEERAFRFPLFLRIGRVKK